MQNESGNKSQEELRARFNPEGSLLRRQQQRMLEMLIQFDAICKKHNIPYWLSSGTMLGCARHKGFIPWDDDLDIEMLMSDYKRLAKILSKELPAHMVLQNHDTDPNYFFSYPKLRDMRSHLEEVNKYDRTFKYQGIYIDIFLLEKSPGWIQKLSCDTIGHVYKILKDTSLTDKSRQKKVDFWYNLNHRFIYPIMRLISKCHKSRMLHHTFGTPYPAARCIDEIFPLATAEFEGVMLPVPHDYDKYLRRMFGNYMKLPNLDELHPHYQRLTIQE